MAEQKDAPIVTARDLTGAATAAGAAAGQALLLSPADAPSVLAIAAVVATLLPPVVMAMTEASARRLKNRGDRFWRSLVADWVRNSDLTQEEVAGRLESKKDDPAVSDAIWRAVRGMMEAPNEKAAVVLGVLAAQYSRDGRRADAFFRGTVRVLSDLSDEEADELSSMLSWALSSSEGDRIFLIAQDREQVDGRWQMIPWRVELLKEYLPDQATELRNSGAIRESLYLRCPHSFTEPERLFSLLKIHGLALDSDYNPTWGGAPPNMELVRTSAQRLLSLLRAQQS